MSHRSAVLLIRSPRRRGNLREYIHAGLRAHLLEPDAAPSAAAAFGWAADAERP